MRQPLTASTNAPHPTLAALPNLFLLNPKNRAFVEGTSKSIAIARIIFLVPTSLVVTTVLILTFTNLKVTEWDTFLQQEQAVTEGNAILRHTFTTGDGEGGTYEVYRISYQFFLPGNEGEFQTGSQEVDQATFNSIPDGSVFSITYLPADPKISWITGHDLYTDPTPGFSILLLFACVVTLLALDWLIRYVWRKRRLARKGQLIRGKVNEWHLEEQVNEGITLVAVISSQFETPKGRKFVTRHIRKNYELRPQAGDPIAVLYVNDRLYEML